ncbi:hypothetical protein JCM10213_005580 [Rhodosporidiobolus nylandii]
MASSTERTLAVLLAPEGQQYAARVRQILLEDGFVVVKEEQLPGEELEEAGLDLGLGVGEEGIREDKEEVEMLHTALVLDRSGAISRLKELQSSSFAKSFPDLRLFLAPSVPAAHMTIDNLFPSLPISPSHNSPTLVAFPSTGFPADSKPKPFALSNLAFAEKKSLTPPSSTRQLSPSIEKALEELEEREERRRTGSTSTRSAKSSMSTPRLASRASGFASTCAADGFAADEAEMTERRVFTAHSRESSGDYGAADREEAALELDLANENGEEGSPQDLLDEAGTADAETGLNREEHVAGVAGEIHVDGSPSLLSAPTFSRTTSNISCASGISDHSSTSFRARPAPSSNPAIQPRMTKAAALRLGVPLPPTTPRRSSSETSSAAESVPAIPRVVPTPKSLAAPSIAPRLTKAAALRAGQDVASLSQTPRPAKRQSISTADRAAMDRAARRLSIQVPSLTTEPAVAVRMSRAAMLRQGKELPPITPRPSRQSSATSATSADEARPASSAAARCSSITADLKALREPAHAPRPTRSSALRAGGEGASSAPMARGRSLGTLEDLVAEHQGSLRVKQPMDFEGVPGHKRRESIQVKATAPPKVEVRMSRTARLRAGILEEDEKESASMRRAKTEPVSFEGVPGHKRRETIAVASFKPPSITPRLNRAVLLRQASEGDVPTSPLLARRPASALAMPTAAPLRAPTPSRSSVTASPAPPTTPIIAPRSNKAAELRAAKKAAEAKKEQGSLRKKPAPLAGAKATRPASSLGLALREMTNSPKGKK